MYKDLQIKICIILILYFQPIAQSYKLYQLNSDAENELLPKLKQILQNNRDNDNFRDYTRNDHTDREDESITLNESKHRRQKKYKPLGKSLFVKRVIPHGYKSDTYEYDSKLNTVFKPLIRFHVKKPIEEHETDILKEIELKKKVKDGFNDALIVLVKKDRRDRDELLRQIQKYINLSKKKRNSKRKKLFRGLLSRLQNKDVQNLRTVLFDKSGEAHDPYAPGHIPTFLVPSDKSHEEADTGPKVVIPTYPFWNYWTYQKQIIQDVCKGNLIKMGDMCVSVVGHRKSNDEPIKRTVKSRKSLKSKNLRKSKNQRKSIKAASPKKSRKSIKAARKKSEDKKK